MTCELVARFRMTSAGKLPTGHYSLQHLHFGISSQTKSEETKAKKRRVLREGGRALCLPE